MQTGMELEFKKLSNVQTETDRFVSANLPVNKFKNRLVNILPYESSRVCLQPMRGIEGSDYINASYIDGYRYRNAYIATQGPLNETVEDFWRMLWEHNSTIIVMLTKQREMGRVRPIYSLKSIHRSSLSNRKFLFVMQNLIYFYLLTDFRINARIIGQVIDQLAINVL